MKKVSGLVLATIAALVGCDGSSSSGASVPSEELVYTGRHGSCYVGTNGPEFYMKIEYETPLYSTEVISGGVYQAGGFVQSMDMSLFNVSASLLERGDVDEYFCQTAPKYFMGENEKVSSCGNGKMHIDMGTISIEDYEGISYEEAAAASAEESRIQCRLVLETIDQRVYGEEMQSHFIKGCTTTLQEDGKTLEVVLTGDDFTATEKTTFDGTDSYTEETYTGLGADFLAQVCEAYKLESGNYNVSCTDNTITYWTHDEPLTSQELEIMEDMFCQMVEHTSLEEIVFME